MATARKSSLREMQKELTREHVMRSAQAVFDRQGFTSATIDDIVAEADLSRATIYAHFENKSAILRAAVARLPEVMPLLEDILAAGDRAARETAFGALHAYWREHLDRVWRHTREAAATDPQMHEWMMHTIRTQNAMVQRAAERLGTAAPRAAAGGFAMGCLWPEYAYRIAESDEALDDDAVVATLTDLFEAAVGIR